MLAEPPAPGQAVSQHRGHTGYDAATHHLGHATCWWHHGQEEPPAPASVRPCPWRPASGSLWLPASAPSASPCTCGLRQTCPWGGREGDVPTPSAIQAAGDPHIALGCCPVLPTAPLCTHPARGTNSSWPEKSHRPRLDSSSGQYRGKAEHPALSRGPFLPSQDLLGAEVELGADAGRPQGDDAVCKGRRRRRDVICPERRAGVRRGATRRGPPHWGAPGCTLVQGEGRHPAAQPSQACGCRMQPDTECLAANQGRLSACCTGGCSIPRWVPRHCPQHRPAAWHPPCCMAPTLPHTRSPPSRVSRSPSPGHAAACRPLWAATPPTPPRPARPPRMDPTHPVLGHPCRSWPRREPHEHPLPPSWVHPQPCHPCKDGGAGHGDTLSPATGQAVAVTPWAPLPPGQPRPWGPCQAVAGAARGGDATHLALFTVKQELEGHGAGNKPTA